MKRIIYLIFAAMVICMTFSCAKPEDSFVLAKSQDARITRFRVYKSLNEFFDATIMDEAGTIDLSIPADMPLKLKPEIIVPDNASVTPSTGEEQDFSSPVKYVVTAEDGITTREYVVTVTNNL